MCSLLITLKASHYMSDKTWTGHCAIEPQNNDYWSTVPWHNGQSNPVLESDNYDIHAAKCACVDMSVTH